MRSAFAIALRALLLIPATAAAQAAETTAAAATAGLAPVFHSDAVLQLRVEAPIPDILRSRGENADYFPATLYYRDADGNDVPAALRIKTRGNFRNREGVCRFPPLQFNFARPEVDVTIFAGENRLKLVTHCQPRARYEQYVLLEYLNYRVYNLLSDTSLRVRLLELSYVNSATGKPMYVKPGFIIEDIGRLAARRDLAEVTLQRAKRTWYEPESALLVAVYQYLLGNTDWSIVVGAPDDTCCHNMFVLQSAAGDLVPVPYDLDVTGIVDPGYGHPPAGLPIRRLTQRLWRGGCPDPDLLALVLQRFRAARTAIVALYADQPGLSPPVRSRTLAFIDAFYAVIDDAERVQTEFFDACD